MGRVPVRFMRTESVHYWIRVERRKTRRAMAELAAKLNPVEPELHTSKANDDNDVTNTEEPVAFCAKIDHSCSSYNNEDTAFAVASEPLDQSKTLVNSRIPLEPVEQIVVKGALAKKDMQANEETLGSLIDEFDRHLSSGLMGDSYLPRGYRGMTRSQRCEALAEPRRLLDEHGLAKLQRMCDRGEVSESIFKCVGALDVVRSFRPGGSLADLIR